MYDANQHARFMRGACDAMFECIQATLAAGQIWQDQVLNAATSASTMASDRPSSNALNPTQSFAPSSASAARTDAGNPFQAWEWAFDMFNVKQPAAAKAASIAPASVSWMPMMAMMAPWLSPPQAAAAPPTFGMPLFGMGFGFPTAANPFAAWFAQPSSAMKAPALPSMFAAMSSNPFSAAFQYPSKAFDPAHFGATMEGMIRAYWSMPPMPWSLCQMPMTAMFISAGIPYAVAAPAARASAAALDAADAARLQAIKALDAYSAYRSDGGHASAQIINWPYDSALNRRNGS